MNLEKIWALYKSSLKAFLLSKVSNPADVDDLLQEILIKTHNNLNSLRQTNSVKSWLFQVANRTIIDFYRKKNGPAILDNEALWYGEQEPGIKFELSQCIEPFLMMLPEEQAALLRNVELNGKSQKIYAQELGLSYSTLKSRVQKARTALRALFEDCCHYSVDKQGNLIDFDQKSIRCKNC